MKVKYLHYAETMQEGCLRLMGKKLLVSLAIEGKFSAEGLQAINDEDDILMAMARELVTEKGIGEKADEVWSRLQKRQEEAFAVKASQAEEATPEAVQEGDLVASESSVSPPTQWLPAGAPHELIPRKGARRVAPCEGQLTLF